MKICTILFYQPVQELAVKPLQTSLPAMVTGQTIDRLILILSYEMGYRPITKQRTEKSPNLICLPFQIAFLRNYLPYQIPTYINVRLGQVRLGNFVGWRFSMLSSLVSQVNSSLAIFPQAIQRKAISRIILWNGLRWTFYLRGSILKVLEVNPFGYNDAKKSTLALEILLCLQT